MNNQIIEYIKNNDYNIYDKILSNYFNNRVLIICNKSILNLYSFEKLICVLEKYNIHYEIFTDFVSNPDISSIVCGLQKFNSLNIKLIIAFGGGSAIDVAKCIKYFYNNNYKNIDLKINNSNYISKDIDLVAIPTTAGSGSESTSFAVIYQDNIKYSIESNHILPNYVILDSDNLKSLPIYQKKSTLLDAFAHAFESFWSVNSNEDSKKLSAESISTILNNYIDYIDKNDKSNLILYASNISGQAINITKTTAAHAMSYSLTKIANISHGHSVSLCLKSLIEFVLNNYNDDNCNDIRGVEYLNSIFNDLVSLFSCNNKYDLIDKINYFVDSFDLNVPSVNSDELNYLVNSVNVDRLNNNPIKLTKEDIRNIYMNCLNII